MKTVGAFEAKTHLSQLLTDVEQTNEEVLIRKRGRGVAYLVPCAWRDEQRRRDTSDDILAAFKQLRGNQEALAPGEMKAMIEEGRKW